LRQLTTQKATKFTEDERYLVLRAVIEADLSRGIGNPDQVEAWRELEWRRCVEDPVYFLDNYGFIMLKEGGIEKWELWPVQRRLLEDWKNGESIVAVKARQLGITTLSAHFALWDVMFHEAARWHIFSSSEEKARDIIERVQATKDRIPEWMLRRASRKGYEQSEVTKRRDKSDSFTRISFGLSEMKIMTSTPKSIQGAAGKFILDEFTLHTEQQRKFHMLLPAIDGGGQCIIIANGNGEDVFYQIYQRAKEGKNRFKPYFFNWRDDPRRDEEWYSSAEQEFMLDPRNAEKDVSVFHAMYPNTEDEAFFIGGNSRFSLKRINEVLADIHAKEANNPGFFASYAIENAGNGYEFRETATGKWHVYEKPEAGARYAIGVDPSGGLSSGDYGVITVLKLLGEMKVGSKRFSRLRQVAVFRGKVEPSLLASEAGKVGVMYNTARINVEANNHGGLVLERLKYSYYNLYMRKKNEKFTSDNTDLLGYWMTTTSKKFLIDQLAEFVHAGWVEINDLDTCRELSTYEVRENETTGAMSGMNDDLIAGLAHAVECSVDFCNIFVDAEPVSLMPWEDTDDDE
jgi:hypothetical protein